jgi:hypothetical protein
MNLPRQEPGAFLIWASRNPAFKGRSVPAKKSRPPISPVLGRLPKTRNVQTGLPEHPTGPAAFFLAPFLGLLRLFHISLFLKRQQRCPLRPPMSGTSSRVQLVVSGKFITLFLVAMAFLATGYHWYGQQQETQERQRQTQARFKAPPYFINRGPSVIRSCQHCLEMAGKLKPQNGWKVYGPQEIPATEQRWFLAVEDPPMPVIVSGVLMMPVHPALEDNPALGFDQTKVSLVLYQNLERKQAVEQPPPPQPEAAPAPDSPPPQPTPDDANREEPSSPASELLNLRSPFVGDWKNVDADTQNLTRLLITGVNELVVHAWGRCHPSDCDWGQSGSISLPPVDRGFTASWDQKFVVRNLKFSMEADGRLKVSLKSHYTESRQDTEIISFFTKTAVP